MAHQPHHAYAFSVSVTGSADPRPVPSAPQVIVGLLYGLPPALLLWAAIVEGAKAFF